jgi:hypothetical protein
VKLLLVMIYEILILFFMFIIRKHKTESRVLNTKYTLTDSNNYVYHHPWLSSSSDMALQPISGLGLLFMRFRNLTLIDNW